MSVSSVFTALMMMMKVLPSLPGAIFSLSLLVTGLTTSQTPDLNCEGDGVKDPRDSKGIVSAGQISEVSDCSLDKAVYCPLVDSEGRANTMCRFCGVDANACGSVSARALNAAEIRLIVDTHNALRRRVAKGMESRGADGQQPKAADMFELQWDKQLANSAQRWTDQCLDGHDDNRLTPGFTSVGQNVAHSWTSASTTAANKQLERRILSWYAEVLYWPASRTDRFSQDGLVDVVGHYTQLVWGATRKIGCGFIANVDQQSPMTPFRQTLVCNYGPGGNVLGDKVYSAARGGSDAPGSACPKGSDDGLSTQ